MKENGRRREQSTERNRTLGLRKQSLLTMGAHDCAAPVNHVVGIMYLGLTDVSAFAQRCVACTALHKRFVTRPRFFFPSSL
ncbi:hypothetical protein M514_02257 [Trichuris suis]|uniref:Uncharacterized protein n=1 Tax=Trichuris suis TaxID=68888 RepID=A0A085NKV3_9BILA|nr:hypothetical protein M513_02257 [Trichuris suis]KFD70099.1 hypothetical protein M514_02257 [Trichuris suis]